MGRVALCAQKIMHWVHNVRCRLFYLGEYWPYGAVNSENSVRCTYYIVRDNNNGAPNIIRPVPTQLYGPVAPDVRHGYSVPFPGLSVGLSLYYCLVWKGRGFWPHANLRGEEGEGFVLFIRRVCFSYRDMNESARGGAFHCLPTHDLVCRPLVRLCARGGVWGPWVVL